MGGFGYSLFGFLVAIAILVAVHEYGHFWVARKLGIKVLKFSIGFGRPIFRWRWKNGPTEYIIGLIPLGGFVKMLDEREGDVQADEVDQAFNRKSLAVRSAVVAAGPAFNFLFAILAIWVVFVAGTDDIDPLIGTVTEGSLAESAGFEPGDVLTEIDGKEVKTWGQHQFYLLHQAMKGNPITLRVSNTTFGEREMEIDFSALDQGNIAAVGAHEVARDRKAEAEAVRAGRTGERLIEIDARGFGQSGSVVGDLDDGKTVAVPRGDGDGTAVASRDGIDRLDRVAAEVEEDAEQLLAVGRDGQAVVDGVAPAHPGLLGQPQRDPDFEDDVAKLERQALGHRLLGATITQGTAAQANRAVHGAHHDRADAPDLGVVTRHQPVRHQLRGRQDVAQVMVDFTDRRAQRGEPGLLRKRRA